MMPWPMLYFDFVLSPAAIAMLNMFMKVKMVPTMIYIAVLAPESIISLHSLSGWLARAVQER